MQLKKSWPSVLSSSTSECWDSRYVPQHLTHVVLGIEPRALCMSGKHPTNRAAGSPSACLTSNSVWWHRPGTQHSEKAGGSLIQGQPCYSGSLRPAWVSLDPDFFFFFFKKWLLLMPILSNIDYTCLRDLSYSLSEADVWADILTH